MIGREFQYNNKHGVICGYAACGGTIYMLWVKFDGSENDDVFRRDNVKKVINGVLK